MSPETARIITASSTAAGRHGSRETHAIIIAGGTGERLGGVSKSDLIVGGQRLLDRQIAGLHPHVSGTIVVVAPRTVKVPAGLLRLMEEPPGSGPLAGITAGLTAIRHSIRGDGNNAESGDKFDSHRVLIVAVDQPGAPQALGVLLESLETNDADACVAFGGSPEPFHQYLIGAYRVGPLASLLERIEVNNRGIHRFLRNLNVVDVPMPFEVCQDVDTPADLEWWNSQYEQCGEEPSPHPLKR